MTDVAAIELAVDAMLAELTQSDTRTAFRSRISALLAHMDRTPELAGATDPLQWDRYGLSE